MIFKDFDVFKFNLNAGYFDNQSSLHGINHTYRVMCHVLQLGNELRFEREKRLAFCAAFIHDMSRKHDGLCHHHGQWAAEEKLPTFKEFFCLQGINAYEIEEIGAAVKNHSEGFEIPKSNPFWKTTALLKDADALDRIRLGEENLKTEFLRFSITKDFISRANTLFYSTEKLEIRSFRQIFELSEGINEQFNETTEVSKL